MYFDSDAVRLRVGTGWVTVKVLSEIGVVYTRRGYVPALEVQRGEVPHLLLCGAGSLASSLEALRADADGLMGLTLRMRRESEAPTSKYETEMIESGHDAGD